MLTIVSCAGTPGDGRLTTVHQSMSAMGMIQAGESVAVTLALGGEASHMRQLDAGRCYSLLALGTEGLRGLAITVRDGAGAEIGARHSDDDNVAIQVCPEVDGSYEVSIRATGAAGVGTVVAWAVPVSTCATPFWLRDDEGVLRDGGIREWVVDGRTVRGESTLQGACVSGSATAPEHVYAFEVPEDSDVVAWVESRFDAGLYLRSSCVEPDSELVCNDDTAGMQPRIRTDLAAGRHFLVVDGFGGEFGSYRLHVRTTPRAVIVDACDTAEPLPTSERFEPEPGRADRMDARSQVAGGTPERLYRLELTEESRVLVRREGEDDGAVALRNSCEGQTGEIDSHPARLELVQGPGEYILQVEGSTAGLEVDVRPIAANEETLLAVAPDEGGGEGRLLAVRPPAEPGEAADDVVESEVSQRRRAEMIEGAMAALGPRTRQCWREAMSSGSEVAGASVRLRLTVSPSGRVASARAIPESAGVPSRLLTCLQSVVQTSFRIGAFAGGVFEIDYPLRFSDPRVAEDTSTSRGAEMEASCRGLSVRDLPLSGVVEGRTSGPAGSVGASCAAGAGGAEQVYRLVIPEPLSVRLLLFSDFDAALYIRDSCADEGLELACNDDLMNRYHAALVHRLEPGTYFVFVDGYGRSGAGDHGAYRLHVFTGPRGELPESESTPAPARRGRR